MVGDLPAEPVDADVLRERPRAPHLLVAVVVGEEDVAPVDERHVLRPAALLVGGGAQVADRLVEVAALPVDRERLLRGAVEGERHLVDPGAHEAAGALLVERQPVGARVEIDRAGSVLLMYSHISIARLWRNASP